ncbi:hypothetical protein E3N88_28215 [Mikania micrantha]|uniref:Jacalin-type lectin domain-containing protein n=1 Tax=Mikania micrantha TaxID=192012 RepID=A0A5N6N0G5_9ASTR|nr:hypothetical protein E3N88_28215 [Mikania micrantha]
MTVLSIRLLERFTKWHGALGMALGIQLEERKLEEIIKSKSLSLPPSLSLCKTKEKINGNDRRQKEEHGIDRESDQTCSKAARFIRVGTWGRQTGGRRWSFELKEDHNLQKITIDHGDVIYSLKFTSESGGVLNTFNVVGGCANGEKVSEVLFDGDEKITCINGTIGTRDGHEVISSLSFQTNKGTHGPFGCATNYVFSILWDEGSIVGFYGLADNYIDAIGVHVKPFDEIIRLGAWGCQTRGPQNIWSFQLERNHHLKKITIGHGNLIYSLQFTTEYRGSMHNSERAGGENGENEVSEVIFDWGEEIMAINGSVGLSRGNYSRFAIISSLSFVTNKRTRGPFGRARGKPFTIPLDAGSFAGFYGLADCYINSIGVYLKAST